jgi:hypothetical protein
MKTSATRHVIVALGSAAAMLVAAGTGAQSTPVTPDPVLGPDAVPTDRALSPDQTPPAPVLSPGAVRDAPVLAPDQTRPAPVLSPGAVRPDAVLGPDQTNPAPVLAPEPSDSLAPLPPIYGPRN